MSLPNELLDFIFEYVYASLCAHRAHSEPDFTTGAKLVFSRISLVSKTWHSLSLPFLARHFDGENVEAFTELVKKYQLFQSVKSMYINPEFKGWLDPGMYGLGSSSSTNSDGFSDRSAGELHEQDVQWELEKWSTLIDECVPTLSILEIGSRRRNKLERGPWYGKFDYRASEERHVWMYDPRDTAPSLDLEKFINKLPRAVRLRSLRLNLPDEAPTIDGSGLKTFTMDDQFASKISSQFPNLKEYTLHSHSDLVFTSVAEPTTFPALETLRILNVLSNPQGLTANLAPNYLRPSAATLRHLELQIRSPYEDIHLTVDELFDSLTFPQLEYLYFDSSSLSCTQSDFFDRFPRIKTASIPLDPLQTNVHTLPFLPPFLSHLTLSRLDDSSLVPLADHLRGQNLTQLTRLALQGRSDHQRWGASGDLPQFERNDPGFELVEIIQICTRSDVELCYVGAIQEPSEQEETGSEGSVYWDWDAEDGEEFRNLWSEEKKRTLDIGESQYPLSHASHFLQYS
jgi:hypothetical protein